jgi:hypothetical protein
LTLLVCGSRNIPVTEPAIVWLAGYLRQLATERGVTRIIHGGARGADALADAAAKELGLPVTSYPAEWEREGRAAGPLRNARMLAEGKPGLVLAFPRGASPGTRHMMRIAREAGIEVIER